MKTMCPPGYQHNGFVATHALEHISIYSHKKAINVYMLTCSEAVPQRRIYIYLYIYIYICVLCVCVYIYIYIYI